MTDTERNAKNLEYYYRRGDKHFFRNSKGKMWIRIPFEMNLKRGQLYSLSGILSTIPTFSK